jgi:hypothetical protein
LKPPWNSALRNATNIKLEFGAAGAGEQLRLGFGARLAQRFCLCLAAAFGNRFGEVGKQHGEPEPDVDLQREAEIGAAGQ